jgi:PAS domain S-box-containing protein
VGGIVIFSEDITERKQVEERLREREELFSSIVGQAMDAIALLDRGGRFVEFNTAAHEQLGYSHQEFAAPTVSDIQAEHSPEQIRENIEKVFAQGEAAFDTKHFHRSGDIRNVHPSLRPLSLRGHDYLAAVWTDITERKRSEEALYRSEMYNRDPKQWHLSMVVQPPLGR